VILSDRNCFNALRRYVVAPSLHVRSCVPSHNRIPLADWWKWSFRLCSRIVCSYRLGSSTSGCAATSHITQTISLDIDQFI